jgi:hypothetical protein
MREIVDWIRRITTFLLALFLWFHALFLFNFRSEMISHTTHLLRLSVSEALLFALLLIFSFVASSGFWKTLWSLIYIYCFPFVLFGYACYLCFLVLRAINRWFKAQAPPPQPATDLIVVKNAAPDGAPIAPVQSQTASEESKRSNAAELARFMLRPLRRFMFLWCALLLVTSHKSIASLCLAVILVHLARKVFFILKAVLFSEPWIQKLAPALLTGLNTALAALAAVTEDSAPTTELKNLWNQLNLWRKMLAFFKDRYLVARWAWLLGFIFLGAMYTYIALLFSFVYYGIARVNGVPFSWPEALVSSLFIPFFVSDLPKILGVKFLGGIHCTFVLVVGVGTIVNFLRRKLDAVRKAASELSDRFTTDQTIHQKLIILEQKVSATVPSPGGTTEK